jgi:putative iron-regulated protein
MATPDPQEVRRSFVENYATLIHAAYADAHTGAINLKTAIAALANAPSAATHAAAKDAWIAARPAYLETEVARFYGGPIDDPETGPEGMINSWPLDEAYLDSVEGDPTAGIINQPDIPINASTLREMNERDGEKTSARVTTPSSSCFGARIFTTTAPASAPSPTSPPQTTPNVASKRSKSWPSCSRKTSVPWSRPGSQAVTIFARSSLP